MNEWVEEGLRESATCLAPLPVSEPQTTDGVDQQAAGGGVVKLEVPVQEEARCQGTDGRPDLEEIGGEMKEEQ